MVLSPPRCGHSTRSPSRAQPRHGRTGPCGQQHPSAPSVGGVPGDTQSPSATSGTGEGGKGWQQRCTSAVITLRVGEHGYCCH